MKPIFLLIILITFCIISSADESKQQEVPESKELLHLELPEPYFGGKPFDGFHSNLLSPDYKPRKPFYVSKDTSNNAKGKTVTSIVESL